MTASNNLVEVNVRLALEMPPEITARDAAGSTFSWFTHLEDLVNVFRSQRQSVLHFLPERLIATDLETCSTWWRPAGPASLLLVLPEATTLLNVPLPPLILVVKKSGSLAVAAFMDDIRPGRETPLYHAPLPNINERGAVCLGSTELGRFDPLSEQAPWDAFWSSAFSSHQVAGKSHRYPEDVRLLLMELNGQAAFPVEDLEPADMTLSEWLARYAPLGEPR